MSYRNDKRSRLIGAADQLFHEQGVNSTTLANIAQLADVPLGNVYYYFKSKESIILGVVEYRRKLIQKELEELNMLPSGTQRLISFVKNFVSNKERTASYGDVLGSLCQELGKSGGKISEAASHLMQDLLSWAENQFISLGKESQAKKLATKFISRIQGLCLLTLTFRDPDFMDEQSNYLINWLETV